MESAPPSRVAISECLSSLQDRPQVPSYPPYRAYKTMLLPLRGDARRMRGRPRRLSPSRTLLVRRTMGGPKKKWGDAPHGAPPQKPPPLPESPRLTGRSSGWAAKHSPGQRPDRQHVACHLLAASSPPSPHSPPLGPVPRHGATEPEELAHFMTTRRTAHGLLLIPGPKRLTRSPTRSSAETEPASIRKRQNRGDELGSHVMYCDLLGSWLALCKGNRAISRCSHRPHRLQPERRPAPRWLSRFPADEARLPPVTGSRAWSQQGSRAWSQQGSRAWSQQGSRAWSQQSRP